MPSKPDGRPTPQTSGALRTNQHGNVGWKIQIITQGYSRPGVIRNHYLN